MKKKIRDLALKRRRKNNMTITTDVGTKLLGRCHFRKEKINNKFLGFRILYYVSPKILKRKRNNDF